jgi:hypothetical protein
MILNSPHRRCKGNEYDTILRIAVFAPPRITPPKYLVLYVIPGLSTSVANSVIATTGWFRKAISAFGEALIHLYCNYYGH